MPEELDSHPLQSSTTVETEPVVDSASRPASPVLSEHDPIKLEEHSTQEQQQEDSSNHKVVLEEMKMKLITAVERQADLEDALNSARRELEASKARLSTLEEEARVNAEKLGMVDRGEYILKSDAEQVQAQLTKELNEATNGKKQAEKERKGMETELEELTCSLFEEANKMVASARRDREASEKKREQMQARLADTETLLKNHQEQLADLKLMVQRIHSENEDTASSVPGTPGLPHGFALNNRSSRDSLRAISFDAAPESSIPTYHPSHPTSFPNIFQAIFRTDTPVYSDFKSLISVAKIMNEQRLPARITHAIPGAPPNPPLVPTPRPADSSSLKDLRYFKRCLTEDIEPTLRLDQAPGLSWMARRAVLPSILDGTLIIDPTLPTSPQSTSPCSLCGASNTTDPSLRRTHRFRTSDTSGAVWYALCGYCVGRVRTVCDFVGWVRGVRDGIRNVRGEGEEERCWEESTRLREAMFWARMGGGVVPVIYRGPTDHGIEVPLSSSPELDMVREAEEEEEEEDGNGNGRGSVESRVGDDGETTMTFAKSSPPPLIFERTASGLHIDGVLAGEGWGAKTPPVNGPAPELGSVEKEEVQSGADRKASIGSSEVTMAWAEAPALPKVGSAFGGTGSRPASIKSTHSATNEAGGDRETKGELEAVTGTAGHSTAASEDEFHDAAEGAPTAGAST
ncbi:rab guanine nucleotide exchange factor S2 [Saitoella coloradoensis]